MSSKEVELCHFLTEEFFGPIVADVVTFMCNHGYQTLRIIAMQTKLKNDQVRKALCVLLQHQMASFQIYKQHVQYKVVVKSILNFLNYPKIIYTAKVLYGDIAELIIEEILHHGTALMTETMTRVAHRLQNVNQDSNSREKIENTFRDLVKTHFLNREPEVHCSDKKDDIAPIFVMKEEHLYEIPELDSDRKRSLTEDNEPPSKRRKTSTGEVQSDNSPVDDGSYWSVNFTRFEQFFRDQAIVLAMRKKHGIECGEITRAMLRISEVTTSADATKTQAISAAEISRAIAAGYSISAEVINQHLKLLSNSPEKIIELVDSSGGGCYSINLKEAARVLASAHILSYVEERFGSKSCRIFRLLMLKQHLEQKQVEEFAMIPAKEAKEYLYSMLSENFLTMQEIPRTADHAPSRTFYLYAVNLRKISRMLLIKSYKSISNLIVRQKHTKSSYKRLLDKKRQIEAMKDSLQEQSEEQIQDIEDMLSTSERAQLTKYEHCTNKLRNGQLQIADTVLMLNLYLKTVFSFCTY